MRPLIPQLAWTGISIAVTTGLLVQIISTTLEYQGMEEEEVFELSMMAMVTLGVGEIVGATFMGVMVDKIGPKKACWFNFISIGVASISIIIFGSINEYSWLAYFMCFLWGVQDSCISIHLDAILSTEFESNKEPFSCDVLLEAAHTAVFEIMASFMKTQSNRTIFMVIVGLIGCYGAISSIFFDYIHPYGHGDIHL